MEGALDYVVKAWLFTEAVDCAFRASAANSGAMSAENL
jgi:hypothetical protein